MKSETAIDNFIKLLFGLHKDDKNDNDNDIKKNNRYITNENNK